MAALAIFRTTVEHESPEAPSINAGIAAKQNLASGVPKPHFSPSAMAHGYASASATSGVFGNQSPGLSTLAQEFVPSWMPASRSLTNFSPSAQECAPSWMQASEMAEPGNYMMNMDDFSDLSDSDFSPRRRTSAAVESDTEVELIEISDSPDEMEAEAMARSARVMDESDGDSDAKRSVSTASWASDTAGSADETEGITTDCNAGESSALGAAEQHDSGDCAEPRAEPKLSWAAQQRLRRLSRAAGPEDVARRMTALLNKLTIEKFESLCTQLLACIQTAVHVQLLVQEVFEKAATQHHFIDMYADFCCRLLLFLQENQSLEGSVDRDLKKFLLRASQLAFEKNLLCPEELEELEQDERMEREMKYKHRMLGNLRFVGALLTRKLLPSKMLFGLAEELLANPAPEALESLTALLTVVGPAFDKPSWRHRQALNEVFARLQGAAQGSDLNVRSRCLVKDLLELRSAGWCESRPKKLEKPKTLSEVAHTPSEGAAGRARRPAQRPAQQVARWSAKPSATWRRCDATSAW